MSMDMSMGTHFGVVDMSMDMGTLELASAHAQACGCPCVYMSMSMDMDMGSSVWMPSQPMTARPDASATTLPQCAKFT